MATLQFQIHTDKENVTSAGHKPSNNIQGGKTFQSGASQSLKTPRRALGSVNQAERVAGGAPAHLGLKPATRQTPASVSKPSAAPFQKPGSASVQKPKQALNDKGSKLNQKLFTNADKENKTERKSKAQEKPAHTSCPKVQPKPQTKTIDPSLLPEIEYMPTPEPQEDSDDESVWPKKERVSAYVDRILSWRPSCLFGARPDSDDEEDDKQRYKQMIRDLDNIPLPSDNVDNFEFDHRPSLEEIDLDDFKLPSLEDIALPELEEMKKCDIAVVSSNSVSLDDSRGLSIHFSGNLVLRDSPAVSPSH